MATRPYVPRADGESSIGVPTKKWGNIYAYKIDEATSLGNNAGLGYRQPSTAQSIGDIKYHATLPANWYLECTTAGNTGSGTLTITTPTVGGTVSDGTVTWTIRKNASTQDLTGYLPLSGGAMTGTSIVRNVNDDTLNIYGGNGYLNGAYLALRGKSFPDNSGFFEITSADGINGATLVGKPNGVLNWNGNSLDKSAVVAESLGVNGYRKYASGLIEQWGFASATGQTPSENGIPINLNISFTTTNYIVTACNNDRYFVLVSADAYTPDKFKYWANDRNGNLIDDGFSWRAIGY